MRQRTFGLLAVGAIALGSVLFVCGVACSDEGPRWRVTATVTDNETHQQAIFKYRDATFSDEESCQRFRVSKDFQPALETLAATVLAPILKVHPNATLNFDCEQDDDSI